MNIVWAMPIVLASGLLIGMTEAVADERLPDASFDDWTGLVSESNLPDGSVIFEYTARTFSGNTQGATLAISFIPRFNCSPMVNVRLPRSDTGNPETSTLEFGVGGDLLKYNSFVDEDNDFFVHALASSATNIQQLRSTIDVSSRANVRVISEPVESSSSDVDSGRFAGDSAVSFSLLGSRLAMLSAERHCYAHKPLEFTPQ